mmetsp:Transcript_46874/g.111578  ORF Transcript_46874/g.111578 Transcript_46874/m.111578 type:complete len:614 (+) Transcript_46874:155-1996(+)
MHACNSTMLALIACLAAIQANNAVATSKVTHTPLYQVEVNIDIEEMSTSEGLTMHFDKKGHQMRLDSAISKAEGLSWGRFDDKIDSTGWSELYLEASAREDVPNDPKMYAAGYIEGLLTCVRISQYYANEYQLLLQKEEAKSTVAAIRDLFQQEIRYMKDKAHLQPHGMAEAPSDPYWKQARYVFLQLWGVCDGYNYAAGHFNVHKLTLEDMLLMNSGNELQTLLQAYAGPAMKERLASQRQLSFLQRRSAKQHAAEEEEVEAPLGLSADDWKRRLAKVGHCSALVRLTDSDVLVGHTTWGDYSTMIRIFKYYKFPLSGSGTMASEIAFSSYPGVVSSLDSFYTMDTGLVVMDTSLPILDEARWADIMDFPANPHIPNFIHIMATNRLARSGGHWAQMMSSMNSGTYNSQWMIVDYNLFNSQQPQLAGVLWVVELVPGKTHQADMTSFLETHGYWPSSNRPFFEDVRQAAGYTAAEAMGGSLYSWSLNPRTQAFNGSAPGVASYKDMRELMSRNTNPQSSGFEVSARLDLDAVHLPNGGIDAKVTGRCLAAKLEVQAISSPSHKRLPPFQWTKDGVDLWPQWPHYGLPNVWNFDFVEMTPNGVTPTLHDPSSC